MSTRAVIAAVFLYLIQPSLSYMPPYVNSFKQLLKYQLPDLPFEYSGLEPYIIEDTVRNHHRGHHALYTDKLNVALNSLREEQPELKEWSIVEILHNISSISEKHRQSIINNGGGYVNHNFYWSVLSPNPEQVNRVPPNDLALQFQKYFGSFGGFKELFTSEASKLFGSGYVWLVRNVSQQQPAAPYRDGPLAVVTTINQDTPISQRSYPILVLDVWEHAYYLQHQYRRGAHVADWWRVVDWGQVEALDDWWRLWAIRRGLATPGDDPARNEL